VGVERKTDYRYTEKSGVGFAEVQGLTLGRRGRSGETVGEEGTPRLL
jgi:hypothetical protein